MPTQRLMFADIDAADEVSGIAFSQTSSTGANLPRGRAGMIRGAHVRDFAQVFFAPAAPIAAGGLYEIRDASVISDGAIMRDGAILVGDRLMMAKGGFPTPWSAAAFHDSDGSAISVDLPADRMALPGTTANLISLGWQVFGHWLIDIMPRLERVLRSGMQIDQFLFGAPVSSWQRTLIELCNVPLDKCRFVDVNHTVVDCERMIVPSFDRLYSELHPDVRQVHDRILAERGRPVIADRDLFIARSSWGGSKELVNRAEVERAAALAGFEIVKPENLLLEEQIALFASARTVVGEMGSAMHMTLFSKPGTRVGLIQSWDNYNFVQAQIGRVCDQEIFYVLGEPEPGESGDRFRVDLLDVRYMLDSIRI